MVQQLYSQIHTPKSKGEVPLFSAAFVTAAKRGKQPKCPLTDEWINETRCTQHGARFSLKNEGGSDTGDTTHEAGSHHAERHQPVTEGQTPCGPTYRKCPETHSTTWLPGPRGRGRGAGVSRRQSRPRGEGRSSGERRAPAGPQLRPGTAHRTRSEGSVAGPRDGAPSGVTRPEAPRGRRGHAAGV